MTSTEDAALTTKYVKMTLIPGRQRASDLALTLCLNNELFMIIIIAVH